MSERTSATLRARWIDARGTVASNPLGEVPGYATADLSLTHRDWPRRGIGWQQLLQRHASAARSAAQDEVAVGHRFGQGGVGHGRGKHVVGAGRQGVRLGIGRLLGRHQDQPRKAHGLDGAGRGTDVAGVLGADQDDAQAAGECEGGGVHRR